MSVRSLGSVRKNTAPRGSIGQYRPPGGGHAQPEIDEFIFFQTKTLKYEQLDQFFTGSIIKQLHVLEKNKQDSTGKFIT